MCAQKLRKKTVLEYPLKLVLFYQLFSNLNWYFKAPSLFIGNHRTDGLDEIFKCSRKLASFCCLTKMPTLSSAASASSSRLRDALATLNVEGSALRAQRDGGLGTMSEARV